MAVYSTVDYSSVAVAVEQMVLVLVVVVLVLDSYMVAVVVVVELAHTVVVVLGKEERNALQCNAVVVEEHTEFVDIVEEQNFELVDIGGLLEVDKNYYWEVLVEVVECTYNNHYRMYCLDVPVAVA